MFDWFQLHIPETLITLIVSLSGLLEISKIKVNPWSFIAKTIGHAFNKEMLERLDVLQSDLSRHITDDDEKWVKQSRLRILRFNDELIQGKRHTKEHFDEILDDINNYEDYCANHSDYKNNKAVLAIENVERVYRELESENGFL